MNKIFPSEDPIRVKQAVEVLQPYSKSNLELNLKKVELEYASIFCTGTFI